MADEINFMDLMALKKLSPDSVVEKFGGLVNSSFFDASNMLGSLKIKGLVDFTTAVPGQNHIEITDIGKQLLNDAEAKAALPFDQLDLEILKNLSGGKRSMNDITSALNIRPKDLAMHINKLSVNQFMNAEFRNGNIDLMLTEKGFMQAKEGMPRMPAEQHAANANATQAQGIAGAGSNDIMNKPQSEPMIPDAGATGTHAGEAGAVHAYQQHAASQSTAGQAHTDEKQAAPQQATAERAQAPGKPDMQEIKDIQNQLSSKNRKSHRVWYAIIIIFAIILIIALLDKFGIIKI